MLKMLQKLQYGETGDIIGDIGLQVQHWFGALDISKHVNNLDEYHKKVIDKNDTTSQRIEEIFTNVKILIYDIRMDLVKNYLMPIALRI